MSLPLTLETLQNAAKMYAGVPYTATHKLTMAEDVLDDYMILYGTDEGVRRLEADMLAFLRVAIDKPFPTADEMYLALKAGKHE